MSKKGRRIFLIGVLALVTLLLLSACNGAELTIFKNGTAEFSFVVDKNYLIENQIVPPEGEDTNGLEFEGESEKEENKPIDAEERFRLWMQYQIAQFNVELGKEVLQIKALSENDGLYKADIHIKDINVFNQLEWGMFYGSVDELISQEQLLQQQEGASSLLSGLVDENGDKINISDFKYTDKTKVLLIMGLDPASLKLPFKIQVPGHILYTTDNLESINKSAALLNPSVMPAVNESENQNEEQLLNQRANVIILFDERGTESSWSFAEQLIIIIGMGTLGLVLFIILAGKIVMDKRRDARILDTDQESERVPPVPVREEEEHDLSIEDIIERSVETPKDQE